MKNLYLIIALVLTACGTYKKNIMFTIDENIKISDLSEIMKEIESEYIVKSNDKLEVEVYTNNGEKLVDPDFELSSQTGSNSSQEKKRISYVVDENGTIKLPMIGSIKLGGLAMSEATSRLESEYGKYYKSPFVKIKFVNKRIILLSSHSGEVIPINNNNTRVTEILALSKLMNENLNVQNMRLLRQNNVYQIDLSTIEGYKKGNIVVESEDILYIEPIKRPVSEFSKEYGPLVSIVSSLLSLTAILITISQ